MPTLVDATLESIDTHYIYGLRAYVRSNHWRTPHVRASYPVHYSSVINDPNRVWTLLRPFTYILVTGSYWPPGLRPFNLLMDASLLGLLPRLRPLDVLTLLRQHITQSPLLEAHITQSPLLEAHVTQSPLLEALLLLLGM